MKSLEDFDKFNDIFEIDTKRFMPTFLDGKRIFAANDLFQSIWSALTKGGVTELMHSGLECRVVIADKTGWQKGRLVMKLEFVPDPIPELQPEEVTNELNIIRDHA